MKEQDCLRRFIFEELGVRGEWVRLANSWQRAKRHQEDSPEGRQQLGQALAAVVLLSATIKFQGSMILQAQGDGALRTLVAQSTHDRKIRGLTRSKAPVRSGSLETVFGRGRLVLTVEPVNGEPYQGIVALQGNNLASALESYFHQSEQIRTRLWLVANETHAAGLLLQEMPSQQNYGQGWERIAMLADTITEKELLELDSSQLLFRLFHEETVRLFDSEPVAFACSCSRQKLELTLRTLGKSELEAILRDEGVIEAGCEFCNKRYRFEWIDIEKILAEDISSHTIKTLH